MQTTGQQGIHTARPDSTSATWRLNEAYTIVKGGVDVLHVQASDASGIRQGAGQLEQVFNE